jgi:hypothetical protein
MNTDKIVAWVLLFLVTVGCKKTELPLADRATEKTTASNAANAPANTLSHQITPQEVLPDVDVKRVPIAVKFTEAEVLNSSKYRPDVAELESIESRLEPLLEKEIDVAEMTVLFSLSQSFFNRVPYLPGTPTKDPPRSGTRPWYRVCFQEGRVRCVFKNEKGQERLHQRIFYDDAGAPAVVCEHIFGKPFPNAVHYLQYDERGYLKRYLEFWADAKTGLRLRASYIVQAKDRYENTTVYWFTEAGGQFQEKYVYTDNGLQVQTRKDDQPQPAGSKAYPAYINRPLQYDMKTIFPVPDA